MKRDIRGHAFGGESWLAGQNRLVNLARSFVKRSKASKTPCQPLINDRSVPQGTHTGSSALSVSCIRIAGIHSGMLPLFPFFSSRARARHGTMIKEFGAECRFPELRNARTARTTFPMQLISPWNDAFSQCNLIHDAHLLFPLWPFMDGSHQRCLASEIARSGKPDASSRDQECVGLLGGGNPRRLPNGNLRYNLRIFYIRAYNAQYSYSKVWNTTLLLLCWDLFFFLWVLVSLVSFSFVIIMLLGRL